MRRYFVHYTWESETKKGSGYTCMERKDKIKNIGEVLEIADVIKSREIDFNGGKIKMESVMITNIQKFPI